VKGRWDDNIKIDLNERNMRAWTGLNGLRMGPCKHGNVILCFIKNWEFLDVQSNCQEGLCCMELVNYLLCWLTELRLLCRCCVDMCSFVTIALSTALYHCGLQQDVVMYLCSPTCSSILVLYYSCFHKRWSICRDAA
jgi:hypothetical protein